jgi:acyl-CoA synthetase (AMP-forming)/AMP-acid ligase II/thioesterase domain-containing protein/acyl carrier protein
MIPSNAYGSASFMSTRGQNLAALVGQHAGLRPDGLAILAPGCAPLTYGNLFARIQLAYTQFRAMGIGPKDRIALITPNGPAAATAFLCLAAACGCAPLNPAYRAEELEFYLRDLGARLVVTSHPPDSPAWIAASRLNLQVIRLIAEGTVCRFESENDCEACEDGPASADDIALFLHTSGTTSKPKLVPLLHRNLCASAKHVGSSLSLTASDRCLNIMPLFHIHGLVAAVLSSLAAGGSIVCTDGTYATGFFKWLAEFSPTWYTAVPTMHMAILGKARENADIIAARPLRFIRSSSSALPPQVLRDLEAAFNAPVVEAYGMTEAAHQMSSNPLPPGKRKPGSVGLPAGPDVAIMDASGNLLDPGARGEVVIRGPNVMPGYLDNPDANQSAFVHGWFRTGDEGWVDPEGYLVLTGRLKELINRGGEKISPREIDEVLLDHPDVRQALAFAIPHIQLGEEIGAAVVLAPGSAVTESALRQFAATRLAPFKVPRLIRILAEIPKGSTGKPQRIGLSAKLGIGTLDTSMIAAEYRAPASPLEEKICGIWRDMLKCGRVGTLDNFFLLGGDSLLAAQMLVKVSEAAGTNLPFSEFLSQGTVASLVQEIESHRAAGRAEGPVVTLRAEGSRVPLICIPGHDGILIGFYHLARLLDADQPVYALEAPQPQTFPGDAWNIRSFASHYVEALIERFRETPIHLAGICFGGVAAYEVARQLQRRGGQVRSLILLDTLNPKWEEGLGPGARFAAVAAMVYERFEAHMSVLWELRRGGTAKYLAERTRAFVAGHREKADLKRMRTSADSGPARTALLRRLAASNYRPEPYPGFIHMIRVRGLRPNPPKMGWMRVASGQVSLVGIDFCPRGMLADPAVATVAGLVAEAIR